MVQSEAGQGRKDRNQRNNCSTGMSGKSLTKDAYRPLFEGFVNVDLKDNISLRSLSDNSVVESFGAGGKTCTTFRVYPTLFYDKAHLYASNNGLNCIYHPIY
ncbi:UNVERIFIED_CONTAM: Beta-fructofuranosidase, insoluble isoenzyme 1 [Sesamum radiatum]|uniref:Beta-fructofuranosidase, insoluble isoenzyme 1 n=1 Tax=Sesamum radiatum TaxID=300843 RepID=A0AAW2R480_SESRA